MKAGSFRTRENPSFKGLLLASFVLLYQGSRLYLKPVASMASGAPYIGSKISLVSKAEIRYEGILYAVDTKDATVTLAKGERNVFFTVFVTDLSFSRPNALWQRRLYL